jgi:hypothetical protein
MNKTKQRLIKKAKKTYKQIYPCGARSSLSDCFTAIDDGRKVVFWFNTEDESTHVLVDEVAA